MVIREDLRDWLAIDAVCDDAGEVTTYTGREPLRSVWLKDELGFRQLT